MTPSDPVNGPYRVFDPSKALENIMDDEDLFIEMIEIFIESSDEQMDAVSNAAEMEDAEALRFNAHRLKGAVGAFCAHYAYELALELEQMGSENVLAEAEQTADSLRTEISRLVDSLESYRGSVNG
jgi:HPt (histidine-containing phosphotransfer) domain-containing protein